MKRMKPWILTAAVAALALSFVTVAMAQPPPSPPSTFTGTVTGPDGDVATGLSVEAFVGDTLCTNNPTETFARSGVTWYFVHVHNDTTREGCNGDIRFEIGGQAAAQTAQHGGRGPVTLNLTLAPEVTSVTVEVTVWRWIRDPEFITVSTRPPGGGWDTLDYYLDMSGLSESGNFNQSDAVPVEVDLGSGRTVTIEVTVWRWIRDPSFITISTRPPGGGWDTLDYYLDMSGLSESGNFNQSDVVPVEVNLQ